MLEDAYHYLFQCRKYTVERQVFNDTVSGFHPLNINVILTGNKKWNTEVNVVCSGMCIGIYIPQNAFNNLL